MLGLFKRRSQVSQGMNSRSLKHLFICADEFGSTFVSYHLEGNTVSCGVIAMCIDSSVIWCCINITELNCIQGDYV